MLTKPDVGIAIHVLHHQMRRFDGRIAFHHVNDCVVFSFLYLLATQVPIRHHPAITTCMVISMINPPFAQCDVQMKKMLVLHFPWICSHKPHVMPK